MQSIAEALNKLNTDPVTAHFQAVMEAQLTGLPVATILRELPPTKDHLLSAQQLTRLIQLITQYNQEDGKHEPLHKALEKVKAPLKQSVLQQNYDENLLLTLCQTLDTIKHFELLRHCVKWAQAKWHKPIWMYYRVYAETNGDPEQSSFMQRLRLQDNLELARREKDQRATMLIGNYLDRYHKAHPQMALDFLESLLGQDEEEDFEDPIEELFGHLPDEVFHRIDKKADALVQKISPERLVQELNKIIGHNRNILFAMMKDPDLFTALMLLKAADDLSIDVDVTVEDILEYFDVDNQTGSFPFPF